MQHRLLINIVLFILVCSLGVFLFVTETNDAPTKDVLLTSQDTGTVHTIVITRKQAGVITFKKENNQWLMQSPFTLPANPIRINTILGLLQAHSYTQLDKKELELDRFLLDDPDVSVRFDDLQIDFGDASPLAEQRYVLIGDTVHLINDSLFQQLQANATFFLDNRLLPPGSKVTAIHLPEYELQLENGKWNINPEMETSADKIIQLVNAWQNLEAVSIRTYEETEPTATIRLEIMDQPAQEFSIVSMPPQLILARPDLGIQYHISGYDAEQLFPQPATDDETP